MFRWPLLLFKEELSRICKLKITTWIREKERLYDNESRVKVKFQFVGNCTSLIGRLVNNKRTISVFHWWINLVNYREGNKVQRAGRFVNLLYQCIERNRTIRIDEHEDTNRVAFFTTSPRFLFIPSLSSSKPQNRYSNNCHFKLVDYRLFNWKIASFRGREISS